MKLDNRRTVFMSEERTIKFRYIFPENYNPTYCNGVYGGISPNGDIITNFFLERMPIPNSTTSSINEDGTLSGTISTDPEDLENTLIRYISSGIILNENSARSIYEWLGNQLQELERRKENNITPTGE
jgi:hypothetical protein